MSVRVVIDTNWIFEGLTRKGGVCGLIVDTWRAGLFKACVSDALAYEYDNVRNFDKTIRTLGLKVMTPMKFIIQGRTLVLRPNNILLRYEC